MRLQMLLAGGLAAVFACLVALQLVASPGDGEDATGVVVAARVRVPAAAHPAAAGVDHADEWVRTILARPLFSRDRRPANAPAVAVAGDVVAPLPRLTGLAISPAGRRAIFAGAEGGKPVVVSEGDSVAGYVVQAISPGAVTLQGPDGERKVSPTFDPAPRRAEAEPNAPGGVVPGVVPGLFPGQLPGQLQGQFPGQAPGQAPGQVPGQQPGVAPDPAQLLRPGYNRQRGENGVLRPQGFVPQAIASAPRSGTD